MSEVQQLRKELKKKERKLYKILDGLSDKQLVNDLIFLRVNILNGNIKPVKLALITDFILTFEAVRRGIKL